MKFYDRKNELETLRRIQGESLKSARFTVMTGRRRVGKTELLKHAFGRTGYLYFFVARRSEAELCDNFVREIEEKLDVPIPGKFSRVSDVVTFVMRLAKDRPITLVIDEFQELSRVDPGAYSSLQRDWDMLKGDMKLNLVVSGSVNRLMNKIFRDEHEPLYGRQTDFLKISPFTTDVLKEILHDHDRSADNEALLALYAITGGVAKYVELLMDGGAFDRDSMLDVVFREESTFLEEGRICLSDEFGKDYGTYFTILSAIASGKTARGEIESAIGGGESGGYLRNLSDLYGLLARNHPLFAKPLAKNVRYRLSDNFFLFWFRFIARYSYMLEIGSHNRLKELVKRDWNVFSGQMLERYFRQKFAEQRKWTRIGSWWDRKGECEIDLVAEDEMSRKAVFAEVKRDGGRISMNTLREKASAFTRATGQFEDYAITFKSLSLEDM
jgi:hypothetical protein